VDKNEKRGWMGDLKNGLRVQYLLAGRRQLVVNNKKPPKNVTFGSLAICLDRPMTLRANLTVGLPFRVCYYLNNFVRLLQVPIGPILKIDLIPYGFGGF
jgi:hypothetical protein